ncbi:DNA mismatch repair endonuclease MutL [filamentous cyanobacterium LEGE 11480]|uniref:DNA mismatch repair protein MutL n=1 Tax=Romeriopsis navalis LEGE 11480 TaxID=2777977 RepID=A0A928Z2J8_9CYAN|nr:DNA mismatch repair endonuclease MutL [Romeriopsis navalis]MBE9028460.1 DNA mismatch repair endonuclease MutL [Romeriopsis navalis LEGE 11480]
MQTAIQPLPIEVINLIAAGEVIDSLAAVVRELAENALDAGATRITMRLWPDQWRIHVTDNGRGMALDDLLQAAIAHTTSKIRDRQDLLAVESLGFRGEALQSIAQLADLTLLSCVGGETGWQVNYDSRGEAIRTEVAPIAPGTTVIVENLFSTWESRRQSLPPLPQQLKAVQAIIQEMALAHPQVTWLIEQNHRPWIHIWPGSTAKQVLPQFIRDLQANDLVELHNQVTGGELSLLLGLPDRAHRHRPDWVKIAVNGRFVVLPELEQTVLQHLRRTIPRDRFPICIVHLKVNPEAVDWNRHPAKAELYLQQLEVWQNQVKFGLDEILKLTVDRLADSYGNSRTQELLKVAESEAGYYADRQVNPANSTVAHKPLLPLRAIAQASQMYIVAEHAAGIWLVEQHIAHERVLYEQIRDRWEVIPLTVPLIVQNLSGAQVEQLERIGLEVSEFGNHLWAIRSLPKLLSEHPEKAAAILELSQGGDLQSAQVAIACRSAIRNGTPMSHLEMQHLLDQWQQTQNPHTCPHGRPIYLSLEESSLSKFFRRSWVIGKSHGLKP